ncbi:hypothetical protein N7524_004585 [Penicillium chrysogenum]|nr:hypothetical protein N7524_004585 [Penicillium chrysogenum]
MSSVPDWVLDSKLETHFLPGSKHEIVHTYYEQESLSQRPIKKSEHWQRESKIGGGGFGEVWLERCTERKNNGPQYERCFVKSFGWYQNEASLFITMEYLELGDLHDYLLNKDQPLPELEARCIMFQILEGLDFMHDNGFAHRDLKPRNILLRSCPPDDWWVKIADFGITKRIEDRLAKSTTLKGTPGYIAPELYEFTQGGTAYALDIWAAGEVMFRILTKQPAFKHPGLLASYVQTRILFPVNTLLTDRVSQHGVAFAICLMEPSPGDRMSAKDALQHRWFAQPLPSNNHNSATLVCQEEHTTSLVDSMTQVSVSWSTNKSLGAFENPIPRPTELGTSSLHTPSNETPKFQHESATPVRMMLPSTLEGHSKGVTSVAFSTDGRLVASGSKDMTVKLWNTTTGGIHKTLQGHWSQVTCVAFSPDGRFVVSGSYDATVKLWNSATGNTDKTLKGHSGFVASVAFSPDGTLVASGSSDNTVKLWNTSTGKIYKTLEGHTGSGLSMAFSPDGKLVASRGAGFHTINLWNTTTGMIYKTFGSAPPSVSNVAFSPDGKLLASVSRGHPVSLWNVMTGTIHKRLEGHLLAENHSDLMASVTFSPDGKLVATGCANKTIKLWNTTTGDMHKTLEGHTDWVHSMVFSPDGRLVASGSGAPDETLWL